MSARDPASPDVDSALFRTVLGHFPTGVTVVTTTTDDGRHAGLAVGSFFSVSLEPPLVGFCVGKGSSSYPIIESTGRMAVNILSSEQEEVCRVFSSKAADRFAGLGHRPAPVTGSPLLDGALGWLDCEFDEVHSGGDHWIVVARVLQLDAASDGLPMVFYRGGFGSFTPA